GGKTRPTELQDAIAPEVQMDSDHPAIQAQTAELMQGIDGRRAQVDRLVEWVYNALDKRLATHIPSASGVLAHRVGDCTEHTWLFVAMARAAGIPARPVYGLMYLGDDHRSFGYHAWAEVAVGGHWMAVDPTWNQVPVDATHLALGGRSFDVARVIGQVTIDVVE
ncbi:MAG: transglutaminase-like domain-containing protein, partial [Myxococcota bacterium]|nr:transglutaminase-like domain-containing protein [Myxococcota bacterium]